VAELTAAFVCGYLGLSSQPRPDHAAYVASWLKVLRATSERFSARPRKPSVRPTGCISGSCNLKKRPK
jgi:antirestriction protein ArdC